MKRALLIVFSVLLIDQVSKFYIKTNMVYDDPIHVFGDWFEITFVENPGMAFGMTIPGEYGKLFLSIFRILAVSAIGYYLFDLAKKNKDPLVITAIALVFAGALGNIIDSAFYGLLFSASSSYEIARFLPEEGGYAGFLHGKVVDMLHFPIFEGKLPDWFPFWGGEYFEFFRPVFNIADSAITVGVIIILLFQKRFFGGNDDKSKKDGPVRRTQDDESTAKNPSEEILPLPPEAVAPTAMEKQ